MFFFVEWSRLPNPYQCQCYQFYSMLIYISWSQWAILFTWLTRVAKRLANLYHDHFSDLQFNDFILVTKKFHYKLGHYHTCTSCSWNIVRPKKLPWDHIPQVNFCKFVTILANHCELYLRKFCISRPLVWLSVLLQRSRLLHFVIRQTDLSLLTHGFANMNKSV